MTGLWINSCTFVDQNIVMTSCGLGLVALEIGNKMCTGSSGKQNGNLMPGCSRHNCCILVGHGDIFKSENILRPFETKRRRQIGGDVCVKNWK